ncbi:MAG: ABC transporter ATP-binding protein [Actinomycetota bacterium]|nr:ABC transporter ATP-binding protein [Actinomycetota bacterium]
MERVEAVGPADTVRPGDTRPPVLVAEDLTMSYRGWTALHGLSFALRPGHVMGFLGPNGAGKTTSIRILTTILRPTSGRYFVDGISSDRPAQIRPRIGVLPETLGLPNQITGIEYITYFARLYGRRGDDARSHGLAMLEMVGLRERGRSLIRAYSHGMRQRLGIARALVNDPVVLFLDEPTLGLDPRGQQELLALLRDIAHQRSTGIILCSHALSEVEGVCDDVVILSSGHVVATGSVAEVLTKARREGPRRTALRLHVPAATVGKATRLLEALPGVAAVSRGSNDRQLEVELAAGPDEPGADDHRSTNWVLDALVDADIQVLSFEVEGSRLQDAFMELTEGARS